MHVSIIGSPSPTLTPSPAYVPTLTTAMPAWCKTDCKTKNETHKCDGGGYGTYSKRLFALEAATRIMGEPVCHCGAYLDLWTGEVDRTVSGCYRPGYIVLTCHRCNQDRTHNPRFNTDRFTEAVLEASKGILITGPTDSARIWKAGRQMGESLKSSIFMD